MRKINTSFCHNFKFFLWCEKKVNLNVASNQQKHEKILAKYFLKRKQKCLTLKKVLCLAFEEKSKLLFLETEILILFDKFG